MKTYRRQRRGPRHSTKKVVTKGGRKAMANNDNDFCYFCYCFKPFTCTHLSISTHLLSEGPFGALTLLFIALDYAKTLLHQ